MGTRTPLEIALPAGILLVFFSLSLLSWAPSHFVVLSSPAIGEMFEAYHGALNIERFGWEWGGLQDMATNPELAAHPFLYIHHPNFGLYFSYVLRKLGVVTLEWQNFLSIFGTLLGLTAAYLCLLRVTGSLAALLLLTMLAVDAYFIGNWAFNLHRAFSYFSVFGAIYAFIRLADDNFRSRVRFGIAFLLCCMLIGTDYMFYFFCFFVLAAYIGLSVGTRPWRLRGLASLVGIFGAVFLVRQLQTIAGIGFDIWSQDFMFQVMNRLSLSMLFPGDWTQATAEFYTSQSVLNPGFVPPSSWLERGYAFLVGTGEAYLRGGLGIAAPHRYFSLMAGMALLGALMAIAGAQARRSLTPYALLVSAGTLALTFSAMVAAIAWNLSASLPLSLAVCAAVFGLSVLVGMRPVVQAAPREPAPVPMSPLATWNPLTKFGLAFLAACFLMMLIFPTYFTNWYRVFLLAPICAAVWLVVVSGPFLESGKHHAGKWIAVAVALKVVSVLIVLPTAPAGDAAVALRALRDVPTASNFTPASIASYTEAFSGFLQPDKARKLLETGRVDFADFYMIFERDKANALYQRPRYFVFLKGVRIFGGDWRFLRNWTPVSEGDAYAIYAVPAAAGAGAGVK